MIQKIYKTSYKLQYFQKLLREFDEAVRDDSWKGAGHPDDITLKEEYYKYKKKQITNYVKRLLITKEVL